MVLDLVVLVGILGLRFLMQLIMHWMPQCRQSDRAWTGLYLGSREASNVLKSALESAGKDKWISVMGPLTLNDIPLYSPL